MRKGQKKVLKRAKMSKIFENLGKNVQYFEKGQVIACDYCTQ